MLPKIRCDEAMAKHKSIKFLYHLQRENKEYGSHETLYGNCNYDCKNCICAMYPVDLIDRIEWNHIPKKYLENGTAIISVNRVKRMGGY